MAKRTSRAVRKSPPHQPGEWLTFPILFTLVSGIVVFGVFHYSAMLAVFAAISAGFVGWVWWQRRFGPQPPKRPAGRAAKKTASRKPRKR